jgi:tRNA modification GTPase
MQTLAGRGRAPRLDDTIVALSSAAGAGARAIVRLTGPQAFTVVRALAEVDYDRAAGRQWREVAMALPQLASPLPTGFMFWPGPKTYTGQDLVEIHVVSSMPLVELLLARLLEAGARAAEAGEFTLRAFLGGKLDLTRAEAVLGVIEARDRRELGEALTQLAGGVAQPLHALREDLLSLLADVEAALDFAEEDITFVDPAALLTRLTKGLAHITLVRKQIEQRSLAQRPFRVVLAGPPNAGKSTLFNALLGKDAALVSAAPGTTRDWLEGKLQVGDVALQLVDTAGLGDAGDAIEGQAQSMGRAEAERGDLVLWCMAPREDGLEVEAATQQAGSLLHEVLPVATKSDLAPGPPGVLAVSATTGVGLKELRLVLAARARAVGGSPLAASLSRCRGHVDACLQHLRNAHRFVLEEEPAELLALELRLALEELGAMVGAVYTDDLLDRIFSRFCIGK